MIDCSERAKGLFAYLGVFQYIPSAALVKVMAFVWVLLLAMIFSKAAAEESEMKMMHADLLTESEVSQDRDNLTCQFSVFELAMDI